MLYSDQELEAWWKSLSKQEQAEILGTMAEKMSNPEFALSLAKQYEAGWRLSSKQLAAIRKWAK